MTGKERILATLAGEPPDRVPFVPNVWQWFHVNHGAQRLPAALADADDPVEALRCLGTDVLSKFDGVVVRERLANCRRTVSYEGDPRDCPAWTSFVNFERGPVRRERIETEHGTLTHVWQYAPQAAAPFEAEHWWKDFDAEYATVRAWMLDRRFEVDLEALQCGLTKIGGAGVLLLQLPPTPLKQFHWLAGPAAASIFIADHPEAMHELAEIHQRQAFAVIERVVDLPNVMIFEVADNLDSTLYSPPLFRAFCLPMLRSAAAMVHARGKYLFIHACGKLKALSRLILESGLDCVEGQSHPPLGDWHLHETRVLSPQLILCGGMTAREQEWAGHDAPCRIRTHVQTLFAGLGDKRRFLFASGCNTSPRTPWENLVAFRDAARSSAASEPTTHCLPACRAIRCGPDWRGQQPGEFRHAGKQWHASSAPTTRGAVP